MRLLALLAATLFSLVCRGADTPQYRPEFHFTPARNWINDPNGLLYLEGTYHLFFQYNPFGDQWGHMSWGHAVSRDLLHWHELGVAIPDDTLAMIFSGSAVRDLNNSSGFAQSGAEPPLVAIYTSLASDAGRLQTQSLAYSTDGANSWTKFAGNPVLDLGLREFRDPKVFWFEPDHRWIMLAALSELHQLAFFGSPDLKHWSRLGTFGPLGATDGAWECPDLFQLNVEGSVRKRWVLKVDVYGSKQLRGSGAQYFVGEFDGRGFRTDRRTAREVDYGRDFYASNAWSVLPPEQNRVVLIGWMSDPRYSGRIPTGPWRGSMSLPRELHLRRTSDGLQMVQQPARELVALRGAERHLGAVALRPGANLHIIDLPQVADIRFSVSTSEGGKASLGVKRGSEEFLIYIDRRGQELIVDRSRSGAVDFDPKFAEKVRMPVPIHDNLPLELVMDHSSVELFAADGLRVATLLYFPSDRAPELVASVSEGMAKLDDLRVSDLHAGGIP